VLTDYAAWQTYGELAVVKYRQSGDQINQAQALILLGLATTYLGQFEQARHYYKEALRLYKKINNPSGLVRCMINLGYAWWVERDFNRAEILQRTSLSLCEKAHLGSQETSWAYYHLALTMFETGEMRDAQQYIEQSRNIHRQERNQWGLICDYVLLSQIAQKTQDTDKARQDLGRALQIAQELKSDIPSLMAIEIMGEFLADQGDETSASILWQFVLYHPSCHTPMRNRCNRLLSKVTSLSKHQWAEAKQIALRLEQEALLNYLSEVLGGTLQANLVDILPDSADEDLEALTPRELEVVEMVAQGLSTNDIANTMFISVGTVRNHIKSVYRKINVHSRIQMVERAREMRLISS
jgi:ATP/maltotriose-dependent transcriptional regulator MalT